MRLRYSIGFFLAVVMLGNLGAEEAPLEIRASSYGGARPEKKITLLMVVSGDDTPEYQAFIASLRKDLEFTGQLAVSQIQGALPTSKEAIKKFSQEGYSLLLFVKHDPPSIPVFWWLYETGTAERIASKLHEEKAAFGAAWAHQVAQALWKPLMGRAGIFTSKIAYIKKMKTKKGYRSQICVADYAGNNEQVVLEAPTIFVELSFHPDTHRPRLLVSEFTADGIRLLMLDLQGHKKVVLGGDRCPLGTSVSANADTVIYTESGNIWRYSYAAGRAKWLCSESA